MVHCTSVVEGEIDIKKKRLFYNGVAIFHWLVIWNVIRKESFTCINYLRYLQ